MIHQLVDQLLKDHGIGLGDIRSAGLGVAGPVISEAGAVRMPPLMPGWDQFPIRSHFESIWGCPVSVNNDAELGALGEWAYGAARGEKNVAYIKVGTGIGAGLLFNGRIYRGETGAAGEIGHITIREQGHQCACGNRGCLETVAGGRAIAQQAIRAVQSGRKTQLVKFIPVEEITAREVAAAARRGDLIAQQIIAGAGTYLGIAVVSLVNLINPALIVMGGGVSQIGDLLLEPVRQAVQQYSMPAAGENVRIVSAVLGRRSTSLGAVAQALDIALHEFPDAEAISRR
jgi:glucokinase-like ROK family protein